MATTEEPTLEPTLDYDHTIADQIKRLQTAKSDLKTAIEGKGVTVPSSTKLDGYADLVDSIQAGGGGNDNDIWYIIITTDTTNGYILKMYPSFERDNDNWLFLHKVSSGRELNGYLYFKYKNENYYIDSFTDGNHTLSKQGAVVNNTIDLMHLHIFKDGDLFKVNIQED